MYSDGYSIRDYGAMVNDEARFRPFAEALKRRVTAGSVVLDIGAGTGILSFLACKFGARKVYAVEPDTSIEVAKLCARNIPGSERITWIQDLSTRITLPEPADLVIGDLHGSMPFYTGNIASLADARTRHLKPGGRMLPQRDLLLAAPAQSSKEFSYIESPWQSNAFGLDLSAGLPWVTSTLTRAQSAPIAPEQLLAAPQQWGVIDYAAGAADRADATLEWTIERAGTLHGLYLWFDGVVDDGLGFSNSPLLPELVYGRRFAPLERAVDVAVGDRISCRLAVNRVRDDYIYRWETRIEGADGTVKGDFRQTSFRLPPGQANVLRKMAADYTPTLDQDGQIRREALLAMDGQRSLGDIADLLHARFPDRLKDRQSALDIAANLSKRHG